jgi:8-oxo-dGTP pyrophosphatase MutT (NUDIX family)
MAKTQQVAALPWRQGTHGVEILLVTTRTTKRWLIPKGWTMDGIADHDAAAIEAYEEAGVKGEVSIVPLGHYGYLKTLRDGRTKRVAVTVFGLKVADVLEDWPERLQRQRQWTPQAQALGMIGEPELLPVIAAFGVTPETPASPQDRAEGLVKRIISWIRAVFAAKRD